MSLVASSERRTVLNNMVNLWLEKQKVKTS
jgi:hypothetical protein